MRLSTIVATQVLAVLAVAGCRSGHRSSDHTRTATPARQSMPCDRACLTAFADEYLNALVAHDPGGLPVASTVRFTENGQELRLGEGLWRTAATLGAYRVFIVDPDSGAVAVQTVLLDGSTPVQLLLRLRLRGRQIEEVETLVAREGDTCCWAPERLAGLSAAFSEEESLATRSERHELVAIADGYFHALHAGGTSAYRRANVDRQTNRYENGRQTTNVPGGNRIIRRDAMAQLDSAMFGRISVVNRRYPVVDTQHGALLAIVVFEYPDGRRPPEIISEFFKISRDTIREIRAVMVGRPTTGWQ